MQAYGHTFRWKSSRWKTEGLLLHVMTQLCLPGWRGQKERKGFVQAFLGLRQMLLLREKKGLDVAEVVVYLPWRSLPRSLHECANLRRVWSTP